MKAAGGYRPDIDGLRAVAVLAVIVFHLDRSWLPGGFVGVDIFFTISGFLITRNICSDINQGRFSLLEFYRRRVKRIAPAMLVVVASTLVACQALFLPADAKAVALSAFWSLASAANVYFWLKQDIGYFAADSEELPLLHLWSLGVEEQFYLAWPVLLAILYTSRRSTAVLVSVVAVAATLSFGLAEALFDRSPLFSYYMLPTRAGELLLGAGVAIASIRHLDVLVSPRIATPLAVLGATLVVSPLALLSEATRFPGLAAIPPTVGTALLILTSLHAPTVVARELGRKPWVWIGRMSYSAYLWHWPLLAIYRYGYGDVSPRVAAGMFIATFVLAWLTYQLVEEPLRHSAGPAWQVITRQYFLPAGALAVVTLVLAYPGRFRVALASASYTAKLESLKLETVPAFKSEQVCQSQRVVDAEMVNPSCVLGADTGRSPDVLLWGDSNASHYVGMLEVIAESSGFRFRNLAIGSCPPLTSNPAPFIAARRESDCGPSLQVAAPLVNSFETLILAGSWTAYQARSADFLEVFFATVRGLAERPGRRIIILGKIPPVPGYDPRCREKALSFPRLSCPVIEIAPSAAVLDVNERIRAFAETLDSVEFFDATAFACPDGQCAAYRPSGRARYFDESHLTMETSRAIGMEIVSRLGVPPQFSMLAASGSPVSAGAGRLH